MRISNVRGRVVNSDFSTFLSPELVSSKWSHFQVRDGDLVISASASTGLIAEVDRHSVGAVPYTGLIILRPRSDRIIPAYIRFFVQSEAFEKQIANLQTGATIQHFGPIHLKQLWLTLPLIAQQNKICAYIDEQIDYIDTVIVKAETANTLSQERRTALISAAVTGKIDVRNWQPPKPTSTPSTDA